MVPLVLTHSQMMSTSPVHCQALPAQLPWLTSMTYNRGSCRCGVFLCCPAETPQPVLTSSSGHPVLDIQFWTSSYEKGSLRHSFQVYTPLKQQATPKDQWRSGGNGKWRSETSAGLGKWPLALFKRSLPIIPIACTKESSCVEHPRIHLLDPPKSRSLFSCNILLASCRRQNKDWTGLFKPCLRSENS